MKKVMNNINIHLAGLALGLALTLSPRPADALQDLPLDVRQIDISTKRNSHNSLIAAVRDADGHLWFASIRGLHVYDGHLVRPVLEDVLRGTKIRDIHIDASSVLWVATNSGALAYSLKTGISRWHRAGETPGDIASNTVHVIHEDQKGTIWLGTSRDGLHRFDPSLAVFQLVNVTPPLAQENRSVLDICEDKMRDMWLATDQGLLRLTGNRGPATSIPLSTGEPYSARNVVVDGAGNLWVAVAQKGLWTLPAGSRNLELIPAADVPATHISDLYADRAGDVWIATSDGLFRHDSREGRILRHPLLVTNSGAKTPTNIASVTETSSGTLWIGTYNLGALHRTTQPRAKLVNLQLGDGTMRDKSILCLLGPDDSRLYVASRCGGLYRSEPLNPERLVLSPRVRIEPLLHDHRILSMAWTADRSLILGADRFLLRLAPDGGVEKVPFDPRPDSPYYDRAIRSVVPMDDGRIWFATTSGVFSWKPGETIREELAVDAAKPLTALSRSAARLWFGHGPSVITLDTTTRAATRLELPDQVWADNASAKTVFVDPQERLWIGTTQSLYRYAPRTGGLTHILDQNREAVPNALSFWPDRTGNMWVHTQEKVLRLPAQGDHAQMVATGAEHPSSSITSGPALASGTTLIYGHSDGLLVIAPERFAQPSRTTPTISEVRIFDQPVPPSPLGRMPQSLELQRDQNYLTFTFSVPEPDDLLPPRFFYKLAGVDQNWADSGRRNSVSYAHLPPGHYTLHVKDGPDNPAMTSMRIVIQPPWWMTPWAKAGYAMALVMAVVLSSRLFARLQTERIRKEMLETLVMQDPLTGVPNRRKFKEVLAAEKSRCKRSNHQISVIMIDIDHFKGFNDRFGHQAGDKALRRVAQILSACLRRPEDFVARYGGEEFVIVLPSTNRAGAERVASKIQEAVHEANIPYPGSPLADRITVSLGLSTFSPQTDLHIDSGLFSADQALYQAKRSGRNCFFYKDHCLSLAPPRQ